MATKILMIGNSFSQDTLMYSAAAAKSVGIELISHNLYIGGCTLERHVKCMNENLEDYIFERYTDTPEQKGLFKSTLARGLEYADWDIITFQQGSPKSGLPESYAFLDPLYAYVREKMAGRDIHYGWNMTWAYMSGHDTPNYEPYGYNQNTMFRAILNAVDTEVRPRGLDVIPCGVAVQAARAGLADAALTRDGFHLSLEAGRYTAALTLLGRMLDVDPDSVTYRPEGLSERDADVCRAAVTLALRYEKTKQ